MRTESLERRSRRIGGCRRAAGLPVLSACVAAICLTVGLAPPQLEAADGDLDPTFGTHAVGRTIVFFDQGGNDADAAAAVAVDPTTGEVFLTGTVADASTMYQPLGVAKLGPDGVADWSFGNLGAGRMIVSRSGFELKPRAIGFNTLDGPDVMGAASPMAGGDTSLFVTSVDPSGFSHATDVMGLPLPGGGAAPAFVQDVTTDSAGRWLVCGNTVISGDSLGFVARLLTTHGFDPAFGAGGMGWVSTWIIDPDQGATWCEAVEEDREGRILLLERGLNYSTLQAFGAVQRVASNGANLDPTFGSAGSVILDVRPDAQPEILTDLAVSDYGEIFVVGFAQGPVTSGRSAVFRLLSPDGSSVSSHEFYVVPIPPQTYTRFELERAAFDPAGRLLAGGTFIEGTAPVEHRMAVVRFSAPFTFDSSFGAGGFSYVSFTGIPGFTRERADLEDMIVAPDGRILVAGRALYAPAGDNYDFAVARLDSSAVFIDGFETGDRGRWSSGAP